MQVTVERTAKYFQTEDGVEPVRDWLDTLRKKKRYVEQSKVRKSIKKATLGNFGDYRFLGGNFGELRIDYGPGYRVYFGLDGNELILLLHGGTKQNQQNDIKLARERWEQYLKNKRG